MRVVNWFSIAGARAQAGRRDMQTASFSRCTLQGGGGEVWDIEAKNVFESVQ
jgi:hypothetical protein